MAPNATAPEPVETEAKTPSRQPPSDSVWVRYHPWMEGAMGHLASWSIHLLIIGVAVLVSLAYAWGFIRHNHQLPVEPVQLAESGGGGGNKEGSSDGPDGKHAPLKEGVRSAKTNDGNTTKPAEDRPRLDEDAMRRATQQFPAKDARYIQQGTEAMKSFLDLDKDLRDKLRDGINPAKGNAGTGKDGGTGSGKDKGVGAGTGEGTGTGEAAGRVLNEREKRHAALDDEV